MRRARHRQPASRHDQHRRRLEQHAGGPSSGIGSRNVHNGLRHNFPALGRGNKDTLEFRASGTGDAYGGSLDNVSLALQEPGCIALVLGGLPAAGCRRPAPGAAATHATHAKPD